jgi:60 kDa SS-A/Ro ribonucleoprotein
MEQGMSVLGNIGTRQTPQGEPVIGRDQVQNSAGGYVFAVDDWQRLDRFLILGVEGGTYYVTPRALAVDNAGAVARCLASDPTRTIDRAVEVSDLGLAPKNDPAIFVLAAASAHPDPAVRRHALDRVDQVCRIGTHLFHYAQFVEQHRGWGRALRRAIGGWYAGRDADKVAYQVVKYRQRDGWSHRDLLRLSHPVAPTPAHAAVFNFVVDGDDDSSAALPRIVEGFARAQDASDADEAAAVVRDYRLPWEAVRPEHLAKPAVWQALLDSGALPLGALVRNLGVLTARGVVATGSDGTRLVLDRLGEVDAIRKARLHPIAILNALMTYRGGHSLRGGTEWQPVTAVVDALDAAFYAAFAAVEPAGKRTVLALDVSGSMTNSMVKDSAFSARAGAAAMAMVTAATEPDTVGVAFASQGLTGREPVYAPGGRARGWGQGLVPFDISPRRRLDDVVRETEGLPFTGTDCALPMLWAADTGVQADTFLVYTDSETWAGDVHPFQALRQYRERSGIAARLIVVGMTATEFTIADPADPGMLDVVGFSADAPAVMSGFSAGRF